MFHLKFYQLNENSNNNFLTLVFITRSYFIYLGFLSSVVELSSICPKLLRLEPMTSDISFQSNHHMIILCIENEVRDNCLLFHSLVSSPRSNHETF